MTQRLPVPAQDDGTWGDILNGFLQVSHNADGTLISSAVSTALPSTIPTSNLGNGTASASNYLRGDGTWAVPAGASNATTSAPGLMQLAGDLGGTAAAPMVPGLAAKAPLASPTFTGTVTVPTPVNQTDAASKSYVDSTAASGVAPDATTTSKGILELAGDLGGTAASPSVLKVKGITLPTSAPTAGNVLTATSATATSWTTPAAGVMLDTTAADIQPDTTNGTATAGSTGKAADAGHQHPLVVHDHTATNKGGQISVAGLSATGTASATTYLRGDGSWTTPSATDTTKLAIANNLSDLANVTTARTNLGLGNVDNTSDAIKNAATATLTNKAISGTSNTLSNIPESAVTNLTTDLAAKANTSSLATVATTGSYADLTNKPTIPTVTGTNTGDQTLSITGTSLTISGSNGNTVTLPTGSGLQALTPTATKTAAYTAATGDLAAMNVAGGGTAVTLPTAPADKSQVGVLAIGATTTTPLSVNRGGSTDTIGPSGATTASLPLANEATIYQYDAPNTRWLAVSNVKPLNQLDSRYLLANGVTISGAPTAASQVLTASSTTAASWITPTSAGASDPVMSGPGIFNIRNSTYGGVGDGVVNDLPAFQSVVAAAKSYLNSNPTKRATVYIPPGEYRLNFTSNFAASSWVSNLSLVGAGRDQTIFKLYTVDGNGATTNGFLCGFLAATTGFNISSPLTNDTFTELTIDFTNVDPGKTATYSTGAKAFYFQYGYRNTYRNLTIINCPASSIGVDYDSGGCLYSGNRIINTGRSATNGSSGIGLGTGAFALEPSVVTGNYIEAASNQGIFVEKQGSAASTPYFSWGTVISNNVCVGCRDGIGDSGAGGTLISNNNIINSTQYGIQLQSGNASSPSPDARPMATYVTDNYITGCVTAGVRIDGGISPVVARNRIVGFNPTTGATTTTYGIYHSVSNNGTAYFQAPRIIDNDIELCGGTGIWSYISSGSKIMLDLIIERNRIRANGRANDGTNFYGFRSRHTSVREVFKDNIVWDDLPAHPILSSAISAGDSTVTCVYDYQQGLPPTGQYTFDSETLTVTAISTVSNMSTAGTYTMTLSAAAVSAHTAGTVGSQVSATQSTGISIASGSILTDVVIMGNIARTTTGVIPWALDTAAAQGNNIVQDNYGLSKVLSITTSTTPSINTDLTTQFDITGLTVNITSMTTNLTGTPKDGQRLLIRITDNGTARTITWGASFTSSGIATLLVTTVASKTHSIGLIYDSTKSLWVCVAVDATGY